MSEIISYENRLKQFASQNRKSLSKPELSFWRSLLAGRQLLGYKFVRQKPLGKYIVDFYCSKLLLVIELDGDDHAEKVAYGQKRTAWLNSVGIQVIRYFNSDLKNLEGVYEDLSLKIQKRALEFGIQNPP